jgi:hypothetical protein
MKKLYAKTEDYLQTAETVADWAKQFVKKHEKTDWEEVLENESLPALSKEFNKKQKMTRISSEGSKKVPMTIICWDDAVIDWAYHKLENF